MATQKLDWSEATPDDLKGRPGRWLWVADGVLGHAAELGSREVGAALSDYAAGYRTDRPGSEVRVEWELYDDGEQADCGRHTFAAAR